MSREKEPWEIDGGKRYVVCLQDTVDKSCYKDVAEFDTHEAAKESCDEVAEKYQRSAFVFDRRNPCGERYRKVIESKAVEEVKQPVSPPPRRGRKKVEPAVEPKIEKSKPKKKVITKDDYF